MYDKIKVSKLGERMGKHEEYVNEKTHFAYSKYLKREYFEKARAVILVDGKVPVMKNLKTGSLFYVGGGVDEGETVEQAVVREALEETGMLVKPVMLLQTNYYDYALNCEGKEFVSKRVEYVYLCDMVAKEGNASGLEGEYVENEVELIYVDLDELSQCNLKLDAIEKIKNYIEKKC